MFSRRQQRHQLETHLSTVKWKRFDDQDVGRESSITFHETLPPARAPVFVHRPTRFVEKDGEVSRGAPYRRELENRVSQVRNRQSARNQFYPGATFRNGTRDQRGSFEVTGSEKVLGVEENSPTSRFRLSGKGGQRK